MNVVKKYQQQADECEALARSATTERHRQEIQKIAEIWRKLAADRARRLEADRGQKFPRSC
jgi:CCR4-NOT transcriptional regulation complex NOT5 subunit